jgi:hypothetical protein
VETALFRVTEVLCTRIAVITRQPTAPRLAGPLVAGVSKGAHIAVAARLLVVGIEAPRCRVTAIHGAGVLVTTSQQAVIRAHAPLASISCGTRIPVVTGASVGHVQTVSLHTEVIGTGIAVITALL